MDFNLSTRDAIYTAYWYRWLNHQKKTVNYAHSHTLFVLNVSGLLDNDYIYKQH